MDGAIEHKLINESDAHWVIATTLPKGEAYPFRESTILKDSHMLSKMQYFDSDQTLQKTLEVTEIRKQDGTAVPFQSIMHTHKKGTKTTLQIHTIELNIPEDRLPISVFAPESLPTP